MHGIDRRPRLAGRPTALLAIPVMLSLATAGWHLPSPTPAPAPAQVARQAIAAAAARVTASGATVSFTATDGGARSGSGTVREQPGDGPARLTGTAVAAITGGKNFAVTLIVDGQLIYQRTPAGAAAMGKRWIGVSVNDLAGEPVLAGVFRADVVPGATAAVLAAARQVRPAGTAVIGGVATTRYDGTITAAQTAAVPLALRELLVPVLFPAGARPVSFRAWIDGAHRFRRIVTSVTAAGGKQLVTTLDFTAAGPGGRIAIPAASQVLPPDAVVYLVAQPGPYRGSRG